MTAPSATLDSTLAAIEAALLKLRPATAGASVERILADLAAARFHLRRPKEIPPIVAILGGTGTGKSTLLNRLLGKDIAAASFRRTHTAGAIAVTGDPSHIPNRWLGTAHSAAVVLPSRGQPDLLTTAIVKTDLTARVTIVDTPDLDGDQPLHHAQAERVFRWADAVVFVVTPEKYQMTELLPYYRLAQRYGVAALHVMNKVEEQAVVDDYAAQIESEMVYAVPRDDAAYAPPPSRQLQDLNQVIASIVLPDRSQGNQLRVVDLMDRLRDQVIAPMLQSRREVDRLVGSLRAMETPAVGVDVNPLTLQLQRRLQQRSVLYLMGPGRVIDRVRQVPGMLARLPRTTWDLFRTGRVSGNGDNSLPPDLGGEKPNFRATMVDQFTILQSRIDDVVRSSSSGSRWIDRKESGYTESKLDPTQAGRIADEEIAQLQQWLEKQWNATPRDTAVIERLLKVLPGGEKLAKWSEAAPYILTIVVATHHVFLGPIDLMIIGGWSLATWMTEKLSNQVAARARAANNAIAARFAELAHRQLEQTCAWLESQAPPGREIERLNALADRISESLQTVNTG